MAKHDELSLDHAFWGAISTDRAFFDWFTGRSKFSGLWLDLDRSEKWHQRWFRDPVTKLDSETDITLFLLETRLSKRYAIHIENKPGHGKWQQNQVENYPIRAANRMRAWGHQDYDTALIAPKSFLNTHANAVSQFGFAVSYEEIERFIPAFSKS